LTCAVLFAERGYPTRILAEEIGPRITSAAAGAIWFPYDAEPADAVIYIDDRQAGVGTLFDVEVPAGRRHLRIRAPGSVPVDTTFVVEPGGTTRLGLIALRNAP